jgi:GntR family transcriptional regulator
MEELDRLSYVPVYLQIQRQLRAEVSSRAAGERFWSDQEVASRYGVSRMTARQAVAGLVQEGLLERRRGAGTFLRAPTVLSHDLNSRIESSQQWVAQNARVLRKILLFEVGACPFSEAVTLNLHHEDQVLRYVRRRSVEGRPVAVDIRYLPLSIGLRLDREWLAQGSLFQILPERLGIPIGESTRIFEAAGADASVSEWLEVPLGTPVLKVTMVIRSASQDPLMVGTSYYRAGEVRFKHVFQ